MWTNLLIDRFAFKAHVGSRDYRVYELGLAKGGPKLKPAKADELPEPGFPTPRLGQKLGLSVVPPRNVRLTFRDCSMPELAEQLGWPLATMVDAGGMTVGRVLDRTGLKGAYNFVLEFAGAWGPQGAFPRPLPEGESDTAPAFVDAIRQMLGLQLTEKKAPLQTVFVDFANRSPTRD
jgi:uncharacterized protein (TIGR03435 family)